MKNKVYFYNVSPLKDKQRFNECFSVASPQRKEKIKKLQTEKDKILCLGADVVIKEILKNQTVFKETDIKYDGLGKPFLKNSHGETAHISISHSGEFVMCAVSDSVVGADIEKIREVNLKTADKSFCENERKYVFSQENAKNAFFKIWTLKESYVKAVGTGIRCELSSFETTNAYGVLQKCGDYGFFEYPVPGYASAVCTKYNQADFEIRVL